MTTMTEINRIDMKKILDNDDLLSNNNLVQEVLSGGMSHEPMHFEAFDKDKLVREVFPQEYDMDMEIGDEYKGEPSNLDNDFETSQMITRMQIKVLGEALRIAYAQFAKTGSNEDYDRILSSSYALDAVKKTLLTAHKDRAKVKKDSQDKPNITTTGNVNIQNNTFQGTPNDMLNQYGNAIDLWDDDKRKLKNGNSEE